MERYEKMMQANIPKPSVAPVQQPIVRQAQPINNQIESVTPEQPKTDLGYDVIEAEGVGSDTSGFDLINAAKTTVNWEGRRDKKGNLSVYALPAGDMGGDYEVAGINDRYHPEAFKAISSLPPQERAKAAAEYIQGYTAPLVERLPQAIQPFMQDLAFNRGLGGATKYIQQGLNSLGQKVAVDGGMGLKTLAAINQVEPRALMRAASDAQLQDEYNMAERNPARKKFIPGLEARIRNRLSTFGQG